MRHVSNGAVKEPNNDRLKAYTYLAARQEHVLLLRQRPTRGALHQPGGGGLSLLAAVGPSPRA